MLKRVDIEKASKAPSHRSASALLALIGIALVLALGASASAATFDLNANQLADTFNKTAKRLSVKMRIARGKCEGGVKYVCQYSGGGAIALMATADTEKQKINEIAIIYISDEKSDIFDYIATIGVLMAALAPDADKDERGVAMTTLLRALKGAEESEVTLHNVNFKIKLTKEIGVWAFITKP